MSLKDYAIKWLEGTILSYVDGSTSLSEVLSRIKKATEVHRVSIREVNRLMRKIESIANEKEKAKLRELRELIHMQRVKAPAY